MKYASAEGNVPYLCPGGDKFIAHSAIYNPSEARRSGSRYLSRAGVAPSWRVDQGAAVRAEEGDSKNIFVAVYFSLGLTVPVKVNLVVFELLSDALCFSRMLGIIPNTLSAGQVLKFCLFSITSFVWTLLMLKQAEMHSLT